MTHKSSHYSEHVSDVRTLTHAHTHTHTHTHARMHARTRTPKTGRPGKHTRSQDTPKKIVLISRKACPAAVIVHTGCKTHTLHMRPEIQWIQAVICCSTITVRTAKVVAPTKMGVVVTLVGIRARLPAVVFISAVESFGTPQCLPQGFVVRWRASGVDSLKSRADTAGCRITTFSAPQRFITRNAIAITIAATSSMASATVIRDAYAVVRAPIKYARVDNAPDFV